MSPLSLSNERQRRCDLCCNFSISSCAGGNQFVHYDTAEQLQRSTVSGCDLCGLIWQALFGQMGPKELRSAVNPDIQLPLLIRAELTSNGNLMEDLDGMPAYDALRISTEDNPTPGNGISGVVELFTSRGSPLSKYFNGREITPDPSSPDNFEDIRTWLEVCSKHQTCGKMSDKPLPKRLIDVGSPGSETVCLEVTEGQVGTYLALSYCWGLSKSLVTTMDTLDDNLQGISITSLPKTLLDAVYITRELGFKYIWIDALCIIQARSSRDTVAIADWQDQASKMADVYGNAFITIAAAGAADKVKGCFVPRSTTTNICTIPLTGAPNSRTIFARPSVTSSPYIDNSLNDRAWTFQEALLSRRMLLYEKYQVTYMCLTGKQKESRRGIEGSGTMSPHVFPAAVKSTTEREQVLHNWYNMLDIGFCGRSITKDSDILPALSGVALQFQTSLGGRCYAGIWEADILRGLLWKCGNVSNVASIRGKKRRFLTPRTVYCAPSWSWASLHGAIWYGITTARNKRWDKAKELNSCPVEILDIRTTLVGPSYDPLGQVSAGFLKIRAPVRNVVVLSRTENGFRKALLIGHDVRPQSPNDLGYDNLLVGEEVVDKSAAGAVGALGYYDTEDSEKNFRSLTCLFIWPQEGLMLVPDSFSKGECFRRVGVFTCFRKDWLDGVESKSVVII